MTAHAITAVVDPELRLFLPAGLRAEGRTALRPDGVSTVGHLVESAGIPLPEVGALLLDGAEVGTAHRPGSADRELRVAAVPRPQPIAGGEPRFLLDVHLGALARRMRLVGLDTAYHNDRDDPSLVVQANAERRVLLTRDRGLLHRRALWMGGYVRSTAPDRQLDEVLDRFALPPLTPWTRCTACNGLLAEVSAEQVRDELPDGTRESFTRFARCADCRRVYWHGAHTGRLDALVAAALERTGAARPGTGPDWTGDTPTP